LLQVRITFLVAHNFVPARACASQSLDAPPTRGWEKCAKRNNPSCIGRVYQGLRELITSRKENEVFSGNELEIIPTENDYVLGFMRRYMGKRAVIFANFVESPPNIPSCLFGLSSYALRSERGSNS